MGIEWGNYVHLAESCGQIQGIAQHRNRELCRSSRTIRASPVGREERIGLGTVFGQSPSLFYDTTGRAVPQMERKKRLLVMRSRLARQEGLEPPTLRTGI